MPSPTCAAAVCFGFMLPYLEGEIIHSITVNGPNPTSIALLRPNIHVEVDCWALTSGMDLHKPLLYGGGESLDCDMSDFDLWLEGPDFQNSKLDDNHIAWSRMDLIEAAEETEGAEDAMDSDGDEKEEEDPQFV